MKRRGMRSVERRGRKAAIAVRRGFTLLELLLVLAILVMLTAMAWPTYEGFVADQKLLGAAEQVRNDLRSARRRAIANGTVVRCLLAAGQGVYQFADAAESDARSQDSAAGATDSPREGDAPTVAELPPGIVFGRELPTERARDRAPLVPPSSNAAARTPDQPVAGARKADPDQPVAALREAEPQPWFEFYPDGTAAVATVWLIDSRGHSLEVRVDVLTGEASIGETQVPERDQAEPLPEAET